jgi:hypothetical protein
MLLDKRDRLTKAAAAMATIQVRFIVRQKAEKVR